MNEHIANYILAAMMSWTPPTDQAYLHEGAEHAEARYREIANDLAELAEAIPLDTFAAGSYNETAEVAAAHTALLLASLASFESSFRADVDKGRKKGDRGHSVCILQVWLRDGEQVKDRQDCIRIGLDRIRESFEACAGFPIDRRLAVYASGHCDVGVNEAKNRWNRMASWWKATPYYGPIADTTEMVAEEWLDDED